MGEIHIPAYPGKQVHPDKAEVHVPWPLQGHAEYSNSKNNIIITINLKISQDTSARIGHHKPSLPIVAIVTGLTFV